jgi:hypothetical protein
MAFHLNITTTPWSVFQDERQNKTVLPVEEFRLLFTPLTEVFSIFPHGTYTLSVYPVSSFNGLSSAIHCSVQTIITYTRTNNLYFWTFTSSVTYSKVSYRRLKSLALSVSFATTPDVIFIFSFRLLICLSSAKFYTVKGL